MKQIVFIFLLALAACGTDDGLQDTPILAGQIGGGEWNFQLGNTFRNNVDRTFEMTFFSDQETSEDACTIATTGFRHITLSIPDREGNYNLPFNGVSAIFHQDNSNTSFSATSGFVEITQIVGNQISGFLQARFDDDNNVEGQFRLKVCN